MDTNPFRSARRPTPSGPSPSPGVRARATRWLETCLEGQTWWYRAPLWLGLAWIFRRYQTEFQYASIFSGITLAFHEMGHAALVWFGNDLLTTAGGTLAQLLVPTGVAVYLLVKQRDPFGATFGTFWLGTALVDAGIYAADARAQTLPLVSPFGPVDATSHDWTVMLMRVGRLSRDQAIGGALQNAGMAAMALSLAAGAWMLWRMARSKGFGGG